MAVLQPNKGKLTFETEGTEGGRYHSRVLAVPSATSGLTIGRGYDMKEKPASKILKDLTRVGVDTETAKILSKATGLYGESARTFIKNHSAGSKENLKNKNTPDLATFEITQQQQVDLFNISYQEEEAETKRICNKSDVTAVYGICDWDLLDSGIKEVLVDMKFRGDYTGRTRKLIQKAVVDNDVDAFFKVLSDTDVWEALNVPADRIKRRIAFLKTNATCRP